MVEIYDLYDNQTNLWISDITSVTWQWDLRTHKGDSRFIYLPLRLFVTLYPKLYIIQNSWNLLDGDLKIRQSCWYLSSLYKHSLEISLWLWVELVFSIINPQGSTVFLDFLHCGSAFIGHWNRLKPATINFGNGAWSTQLSIHCFPELTPHPSLHIFVRSCMLLTTSCPWVMG